MFLINHRIAGVTYCVKSDVSFARLLRNNYTPFHVDNIPPDVVFRIQALDPNPIYLPPLVETEQDALLKIVDFPHKWIKRLPLRSPDVWKRIEVCLASPELANIFFRMDHVIISNFASNEMDFFYPADERVTFSDPYSMFLLRWNMYSTLLINFYALMLHGASVIRNNSALLFLGEDGGGKSTTIELAAGMPILNDDQVVLRKQNDVILAHGTPFGRVTDGPLQAKLGAIFLLEKSPRFSVTPASAFEAVELIWNEQRFLWPMMPKMLKIRAFNLIVDACQQARLFRMQFPKDFIDWDLIDQALK